MSLPKPQYTIWNAISAALAVSIRAIDEVRALAREPGPRGEPGPPGRDAPMLSDLQITTPDGGRTIVYSFTDNKKQTVTREYKTWAIIDRGIFGKNEAGDDKPIIYERGDYVSWKGCGWIAQDTFSSNKYKPGDGSDGWRLSTKCGRDGKDGKPGPQGPPGPAGKDMRLG